MARVKETKQSILDDEEIFETQKELLKEKLNIHLDFWTADKWLLEKELYEAKRLHNSQEARQAQEIAEMNRSLGLQHHENFLLKLKLEKALDDIDDLQTSYEISQLQLHEEKEKCLALEKFIEQEKILFSTKEEESSNKAMMQLKKYTDQLTSIQKAHEVELNKETLKNDILSQKLSELETLHKEELFNETQKLQKVEKELAVLINQQDMEQEKNKQIQALGQQISRLQEKNQREVQKLRGDIEKINSQRKNEVVALVRERDFVWDQLKKIEEDYISRLKMKDEELQFTRTEISKFHYVTEELHRINNERVVDLTILRMEKERAVEEVHMLKEAIMTGRGEEMGHQELRVVPPEDNDTSKEGYLRKSVACSDSNTENEFLSQVTCKSRHISQHKKFLHEFDDSSAVHCNTSSDGNEAWEELKEIRRQFEEAVSLLHVKGEELKKTSKVLEDIRLENENLKALYGDLEVKFKEKQKQDKSSRNSKKEATTRNLEAELEAVASDALMDASSRSNSRITRSKTAATREPPKNCKVPEEFSSQPALLDSNVQRKEKRASTKTIFRVERNSLSKKPRASKDGAEIAKEKSLCSALTNDHSCPVKTFFSAAFSIPKVKLQNTHL